MGNTSAECTLPYFSFGELAMGECCRGKHRFCRQRGKVIWLLVLRRGCSCWSCLHTARDLKTLAIKVKREGSNFSPLVVSFLVKIVFENYFLIIFLVQTWFWYRCVCLCACVHTCVIFYPSSPCAYLLYWLRECSPGLPSSRLFFNLFAVRRRIEGSQCTCPPHSLWFTPQHVLFLSSL